MESTEKLTDTNAILAYLYETFPLCFIAEGETKPLKIGLFQDLAERLADDSKVSKTQLRVALRRYTNSWRYLKCIKEGAQRVDLDGNPCGELDPEHIEHAKATLKESQEKAKARRAAEPAKEGEAKKPSLRVSLVLKGTSPVTIAHAAIKRRPVSLASLPLQPWN